MGFARILIAIDGSKIAIEAAQAGLELAAALGAQCRTLLVVDPPIAAAGDIGLSPDELELLTTDAEQKVLTDLKAHVRFPAGTDHWVRVGHPAGVIVEVAEAWPADLIVVGSHGRSPLSKALLGSVADAVARRATCPVLVVRKKSA